jgi:thiamine-monophosphate kinase
MMNEDGIIGYLKAQFPQQIGDDAAVIPSNNTQQYVITQDVLVEDIHFRLRYQNAKSLAYKALQVNLSDLAAMGATPAYVLLGLSTPATHEQYIHEFLSSFSSACRHAEVTLIGGDTTRAPKHLVLSITAIGFAQVEHIKYRHTAKPGDIICVVGELGHAHLGFTALEHHHDNLDEYKQSFLNPTARAKEGLWLSTQSPVHAMMDLSDGLFTDLEKLTQASQCGATLALDELTSTAAFQSACQALKLDPIETQLIGGEDYGLLVTIDAAAYPTIAAQFEQHFNYPLKKVGCITQNKGVQCTHNGNPSTLKLKPFSHF